jgi:hypothetical protein
MISKTIEPGAHYFGDGFGKSPNESFRRRQFLVRHEDLALGEVQQTASMFSVQIGEDGGPHVVGAISEPWQLRPDLFQCNVEKYRQPNYGYQPGK